jgi:hypothetical protein
MLFDIEIVLRDRANAIAERIEHAGNEVSAWTELDVHEVLKSMLLAIDRAKNPRSDQQFVTLRGFSWIVEPADGGVVMAPPSPGLSTSPRTGSTRSLPRPWRRPGHRPLSSIRGIAEFSDGLQNRRPPVCKTAQACGLA